MSDNAWPETKSGHYLTFASHSGVLRNPCARSAGLGLSARFRNTVPSASYASAALGILVLSLPERSAQGNYTQKAATRIGFVSSYSWTRSRYIPRDWFAPLREINDN